MNSVYHRFKEGGNHSSVYKGVQVEFQMSSDGMRNCNMRMVKIRSNFQLLTEDFLLQNNLLHAAV